MIPKEFDYTAPQSLEEALQALSDGGEDAKILAGGHSLIPMMKLRLAAPSLLVDLRRIEELHKVNASGDSVEIGAMITYSDLINNSHLLGICPLLAETAHSIGDAQVRARGTIGGSLAHADPASDMTAAVLALNATLIAAHKNGGVATREIAAGDFFADLLTTTLEPGEILTTIRLPDLGAGSGSAYVKVRNKASHYALAGAAVVLSRGADGVCSGASVAITGVTATPFRLTALEDKLKGGRLEDADLDAVTEAVNGLDVQWMSDLHGSEEYRKHLAGVVARRALEKARSRIGA